MFPFIAPFAPQTASGGAAGVFAVIIWILIMGISILIPVMVVLFVNRDSQRYSERAWALAGQSRVLWVVLSIFIFPILFLIYLAIIRPKVEAAAKNLGETNGVQGSASTDEATPMGRIYWHQGGDGQWVQGRPEKGGQAWYQDQAGQWVQETVPAAKPAEPSAPVGTGGASRMAESQKPAGQETENAYDAEKTIPASTVGTRPTEKTPERIYWYQGADGQWAQGNPGDGRPVWYQDGAGQWVKENAASAPTPAASASSPVAPAAADRIYWHQGADGQWAQGNPGDGRPVWYQDGAGQWVKA